MPNARIRWYVSRSLLARLGTLSKVTLGTILNGIENLTECCRL